MAKKDPRSMFEAFSQKSATEELIDRAASGEVSLVDDKTPCEVEAGYLKYEEGRTYRVGQRVLMPLSKVYENPQNPRVFYFEEDWQPFLRSLSGAGQLTAAQVYPSDSDGRFMLKSGHRRRRALEMLNRSWIKVEIVANVSSPLEEYKQARAINIEHRVQTHFDDAVRFQELLQTGVVIDQKHLAQEFNLKEGDISKTLSIGKLPMDILERMARHQDNFGFIASYYIFQYWKRFNEDDAKTLKLVDKVVEGRLGVRQLEALVKDTSVANRPGKRRELALARAQVVTGAKGELKAFEGRLSLTLSDIEASKRDQLYLRILALFEEVGLGAETAVTEPARHDETRSR